MPRTQSAPEVDVLRFFEEVPIEKAEILFNIIADKMRARRSAKVPDAKAISKRQTKRGITAPNDHDTLRNDPHPDNPL
jgi:hypothetical protein